MGCMDTIPRGAREISIKAKNEPFMPIINRFNFRFGVIYVI